MTQPGLEPGPLDPESSALTTRPSRLSPKIKRQRKNDLIGKKRQDKRYLENSATKFHLIEPAAVFFFFFFFFFAGKRILSQIERCLNLDNTHLSLDSNQILPRRITDNLSNTVGRISVLIQYSNPDLFADSCATIDTNNSQIKWLAELLTLPVNLKSELSCWCHYNACKLS